MTADDLPRVDKSVEQHIIALCQLATQHHQGQGRAGGVGTDHQVKGTCTLEGWWDTLKYCNSYKL